MLGRGFIDGSGTSPAPRPGRSTLRVARVRRWRPWRAPALGLPSVLLAFAAALILLLSAGAEAVDAQTDTVAPALATTDPAVLAADGLTLTLTYNEALDTTSVPASTAFTVMATPAGGSTAARVGLATTGGVSISGQTVVLTMANPIAYMDRVTVAFAKGAGPAIEDLAGNDAADFVPMDVTNNSTVPRIGIAAAHPEASTVIAKPRFSFTRSFGSTPLNLNLSVTQDDMYVPSTTYTHPLNSPGLPQDLVIDLKYVGHTSGDLTYTLEPGSGYAVDIADDSATVMIKAPASGLPVTVAFPDTEVDVAEGATVTGRPVTFTLAAGLADPRDDFSIGFQTLNESAQVGVDFAAPPAGGRFLGPPSDWNRQTTWRGHVEIHTTDDTLVEGHETFYLNFSRASVDVGIIGFPPHSDTDVIVTILDDDPLEAPDVEVTSTPTNSYYGVGDTIAFTAIFPLDVTVEAGPQFAFELGGVTRMASAPATLEDDGPIDEVTFTYDVVAADPDDHDGISWGANAISLNGGRLYIEPKEALLQRDVDNLEHPAQAPLPAHKVDTMPPALAWASVNGTTLTLEFNEALDTTSPPATTAFSVSVDAGTGVNPTAVSMAGDEVTLTLATAVTSAQTVTVSYTKPTTNPIKDLLDKEAVTFTDSPVVNVLADTALPGLLAAVLAADGKTLTLTYNEPLKTNSVPANSAFTVEATPDGGSEAEVALAFTGGVSISGSTVVLTLDRPIAHNDGSVKVTYDKPSSGDVIEDASLKDAPEFMDETVTNGSVIPRVRIEALFPDASPVIADPEFKFTRSNTGTGALEVALEMSQTENHMSSTLRLPEIAANGTEVSDTGFGVLQFVSNINTINTDGMVTLTVVGGDDHLPALAPNDSATIEIKLPTSGPTIQAAFAQNSYTIDESIGELDLSPVFTLGPSVAAPRYTGNVAVAVLTAEFKDPVTMLRTEESAEINVDYVHISINSSVRMGDWTPTIDGGYTYTANALVTIDDDDEHERDEKFQYHFDSTPGVPSALQIDKTKRTVTILDNDPLGVVDTTDSMMRVTSTSTNGYYDATDIIEFTVPFNGNVTVTGMPQLSFDLGGQTRQANYASGSDTKELVFSYTVTASDPDDHDGISWGGNGLRLNGGTIKFTSTEPTAQVAANLAHPARGALPDHKVDTTKPSVESAKVDVTTLTVTFSEDLDETAAPANTAFTVKLDGATTGTNPTAVSISGSVVTLTLASAVTPGQTATVSYAKPTNNPLKDLSGKEADGFEDRTVLVDPPPEFPNPTETFSVTENAKSGTVGTVTATDPDGQSVTYSVGGTDAAEFNEDFTLNFATGEIRVKASGSIDYESKSSYSITITARDTADVTASVAVTINVDNADDPGIVILSSGTSSGRPEMGSELGARVTDPDGGVSGVGWRWSRSDSVSGPFTAISGEISDTYVTTQEDAGANIRATASYTDSFGPGKSAHATFVSTVGEPPDIPIDILFHLLDPDTYTAVEGGRVATVRLVAHQKWHQPDWSITRVGRRVVVVPLNVSYGGGASSDDHSEIPTEVVFSPDQVEVERLIRIVATADSVDDDGEWIEISLGDLPEDMHVYAGERTKVRVYLQDADDELEPIVADFDRSSYSAMEGSEAQVNLRLESTFDDRERVVIPVEHALQGGHGTYLLKYRLENNKETGQYTSPTALGIVRGEQEVSFHIKCHEDNIDREDWTVRLWLTQANMPSSTSLGTNAQAVVTCTDNDEPPVAEVRFSKGYYSVSEDGNAVAVHVRLNNGLDREVTIPIFHTPERGATEADYSISATSVTFGPGETRKAIEILATDDIQDDDDERVALTFGTLPPGVTEATGDHPQDQRAGWIVPRDTAHIYILDNDAAPSTDPPPQIPERVFVFFREDSYTADEGKFATVRLRLSLPPGQRVVVPIVITGRGPGASGYTFTQDAIFEADSQNLSFRFPTIDDDLDDDEGVWVELGVALDSLPEGVFGHRVLPTKTRIEVLDNDHPQLTVSFDSATYSVAEVEGDPANVDVKVTLSANPEREVLIPIRLTHQNGTGIFDYRIAGNPHRVGGESDHAIVTLRFKASDPLSKTFKVQAINDDDDDDDERLGLSFVSLPERISAGPDAVVNLVDND